MKRVSRWLCLLLCLVLLPQLGFAEESESLPQILDVSVTGAVITVRASEDVAAYCITTLDVVPEQTHPDWRPCEGDSFSAFKMDGSYYVRVRTEDGRISEAVPVTVRSGFVYGIEAEGVTYLNEPIETVLEANGDSIDRFNADLAYIAKEAGMYTPEAVASVCMTLMTRLAEYGVTLSYQPKGNFTLEHDWGLSPLWGTVMDHVETDAEGEYRRASMNCGTIIKWAYKQAGLNLQNDEICRGLYDFAQLRRQDDNRAPLDAGDTGDVIATGTGHTMLILDRVDTDGDGLSDSYLVFEMESPYLKLKIRSLYSVRLCTLYRMSAVFSDTGALKRYARFWKGSFHIPAEAFPAYYTESDGSWFFDRR